MVSLHTKDGELHRPSLDPREWPIIRANIPLGTFRSALQKRQEALFQLQKSLSHDKVPAGIQNHLVHVESKGNAIVKGLDEKAPIRALPRIPEDGQAQDEEPAQQDINHRGEGTEKESNDGPTPMDVDGEPAKEPPTPPETPSPTRSEKEKIEGAENSPAVKEEEEEAEEEKGVAEAMDLASPRQKGGEEKQEEKMKVEEPAGKGMNREETGGKTVEDEEWEAERQEVRKRKAEAESLLNDLQHKKHKLVQKLKEVLHKEEEARRKAIASQTAQSLSNQGSFSPNFKPPPFSPPPLFSPPTGSTPLSSPPHAQHHPSQPPPLLSGPPASNPFSPDYRPPPAPPAAATPAPISSQEDNEREEGELEPGHSPPPMAEEDITPPPSPPPAPAPNNPPPSLERTPSANHSSGSGRGGGQSHAPYGHPSTPLGPLPQPMTPGGRHSFTPPQGAWTPTGPRLAGPFPSSLSGSLSPPPMGSRQISPASSFRGQGSPHLGNHPYGMRSQQQGRGMGMGMGHAPHGPMGLPGGPGGLGNGPSFGAFGSPGGMHPHNLHGGRPPLGNGPLGPLPGNMSPSMGGPRPPMGGMRFQPPWNINR